MQTEIENKISFENIIRNRISHFQNIYHANEAGRLTLALRAIEELIPPSHFKSSPPVEQTESKEQKLFTIEQVAVICCWIFDGDYIHTLTNKNETHKEIKRLVKHYSDFPEFEQNLKNK